MRGKIIKYLKQHPGFVSGEDLSRGLGVSRTAVWKCIEELRECGYVFEAVPHYGYKLMSVPDKLTALEVQDGLGTRKFGCEVHHFESIGSTMDEAFRLGVAGAPEGAVVTAEHQLKGRGRLGRVWVSPRAGGLYFSMLLRPSLTLAEVSKLTLLSAVALSEAVELYAGLRPLIKWPNDLLIGGKKTAGILTELRAELDRVDFVVLGVGINVNTARRDLPPEAVSLMEKKGGKIDRAALLREILRAFEKRYLGLKKNGFGPVLDEWRRRSATIGSALSYEERGRRHSGVATGLDDDGGLWVRLDSGVTVKRMAGDIVLGSGGGDR
jgi:BirA family biotin operon repressor/biotin-[acetyl-CoA-carboxylase] ligase